MCNTKFDPSKPVQTRNGRKARITNSNTSYRPYQMHGYVVLESGQELSATWTRDGQFYSDGKSHGFDLFNVPEETPKLDLSKPVQTRDGRKVRIERTDDRINPEYPVVGWVLENGVESFRDKWTLKGECLTGLTHHLDLINVPEAAAPTPPAEKPLVIEMGKQYQTKDGRAVRVVATDLPGDYPVIGLLGDSTFRWTASGLYYGDGSRSPLNLIPVPPPERKWVEYRNIWLNGDADKLKFGPAHVGAEGRIGARNAVKGGSRHMAAVKITYSAIGSEAEKIVDIELIKE